MATQDINRSISGIKVLNVKCSKTSDKAYNKRFQVLIRYKSRYDPDSTIDSIELRYKYDSQNMRWIRPKKSDILNITEFNNHTTASNSVENAPANKDHVKKLKKEYKKNPIRRYMRLIGIDHKKNEE